jgi:hypothetical protein
MDKSVGTRSERLAERLIGPAAGTNGVYPEAHTTKVGGLRKLDMLRSDKTVDFQRGFDGVSSGIKSVDRQ